MTTKAMKIRVNILTSMFKGTMIELLNNPEKVEGEYKRLFPDAIEVSDRGKLLSVLLFHLQPLEQLSE